MMSNRGWEQADQQRTGVIRKLFFNDIDEKYRSTVKALATPLS
jgi:hypothetical protein